MLVPDCFLDDVRGSLRPDERRGRADVRNRAYDAGAFRVQKNTTSLKPHYPYSPRPLRSSFPPAPPLDARHLSRMLPSPNDPCPCGSGRMYQRCHYAYNRVVAAESGAAAAVAAASASPYDALAAAFKERDAALSLRLLRFARARYGAEWPTDVLKHECVLHYHELCDVDSPFLIPWMEHFWSDATGLTLAQAWQRHGRGSASDDDGIILEAYANAWASIWEVNAVQPGTGVHVVDLLTGQERFVRDVCDSRDLRSTEPLQLFDSVLAIVIDCGGMSLFGGVYGQRLSPCWAEFATQEARGIFAVGTGAVTPRMLRHPEHQLEMLLAWNDAVEEMSTYPLPMMRLPNADLRTFWIDEYELTAPYDEVASRLAALPGAEDPVEERGRLGIIVDRDGGSIDSRWENTVLAGLALWPTLLRVEASSIRRADDSRAMLETHLPGMLRFLVRREGTTEWLLAHGREPDSSANPPHP